MSEKSTFKKPENYSKTKNTHENENNQLLFTSSLTNSSITTSNDTAAINELNKKVNRILEVLIRIEINQSNLSSAIEKIQNSDADHQNQATIKALEDIYNELYIIKKRLVQQDNNKAFVNKNNRFPDFPIKNFSAMDEFEKKLKQKSYFDDIQKSLTEHIYLINPSSTTIESFFRSALTMMFDETFTENITWKSFPNKKALSLTNIADLLQSN